VNRPRQQRNVTRARIGSLGVFTARRHRVTSVSAAGVFEPPPLVTHLSGTLDSDRLVIAVPFSSRVLSLVVAAGGAGLLF
jgi:hypothetical protein